MYRLHLTPFFAFFRHCGAWSKASTEGELASVIFYQNNNNNGHNQSGGVRDLGAGFRVGEGQIDTLGTRGIVVSFLISYMALELTF